jgi:hypothetical protein
MIVETPGNGRKIGRDPIRPFRGPLLVRARDSARSRALGVGEYYIVANPEKRQYLNSNSLAMSVKLSGLIAGPLPRIVVWLLADGLSVSGGTGMRGSWSGDRIIVAGDEGPSATIYARAHAEFRDITVEAFEALAADCSFFYLEYSEAGILDDDGRFIPDWSRGDTTERPP